MTDQFEEFSEKLRNHINNRSLNEIDNEIFLEVPQYKDFLQDIKQGDSLEFFIWNAGFLKYAEGYRILRDGVCIKKITTVVS